MHITTTLQLNVYIYKPILKYIQIHNDKILTNTPQWNIYMYTQKRN